MGFVAESRWDSRRGFGLFIAYCSRCHCSKTVGPAAHRQPSTRNQQPPHPPSRNPEVGSALQPRVARFPALPWVRVAQSQQPHRGCAEATSGHLAPHRPSSETDPSREIGQRPTTTSSPIRRNLPLFASIRGSPPSRGSGGRPDGPGLSAPPVERPSRPLVRRSLRRCCRPAFVRGGRGSAPAAWGRCPRPT